MAEIWYRAISVSIFDFHPTGVCEKATGVHTATSGHCWLQHPLPLQQSFPSCTKLGNGQVLSTDAGEGAVQPSFQYEPSFSWGLLTDSSTIEDSQYLVLYDLPIDGKDFHQFSMELPPESGVATRFHLLQARSTEVFFFVHPWLIDWHPNAPKRHLVRGFARAGDERRSKKRGMGNPLIQRCVVEIFAQNLSFLSVWSLDTFLLLLGMALKSSTTRNGWLIMDGKTWLDSLGSLASNHDPWWDLFSRSWSWTGGASAGWKKCLGRSSHQIFSVPGLTRPIKSWESHSGTAVPEATIHCFAILANSCQICCFATVLHDEAVCFCLVECVKHKHSVWPKGAGDVSQGPHTLVWATDCVSPLTSLQLLAQGITV